MSEFSIREMLRSLPYFSYIAETSLDEITLQASQQTFTADEILFLEGSSSAGLWILESGRVKAYKLAMDGQEYIMRFFGPGDTFNDLAAIDGAPNPTNTMAVTDVSAWVIPASAFSEILKADHEFALAMLKGLVGRARFLVGRIEDLALHPVVARLAHFLLEQSENPTLNHPAITRALIANHLATTPETISRSLRVLEEAGAIRFDRHRIFIIQPEILRKQAQG